MATPKLQDILEVFNLKLDELQILLQEKININLILKDFSKVQSEKTMTLLKDIDDRIQILSNIKLELNTDNLDDKRKDLEQVFDFNLKELDSLTQKNKSNHEQISQDYIRIFRKESQKGDKYFRFFVWSIGVMAGFILILSLKIYSNIETKTNLSNENKVAKTKVFYLEKFLKEKEMKDNYFKWLKDQH